MPRDPYAKGTAGCPMDLPLLAHICGDPLSSGVGSIGGSIEGYFFSRTATHLAKYVQKCKEHGSLYGMSEKAFVRFEANISELARTEDAIEGIHDLSQLEALANASSAKIQALKSGETFSMPGGWSSSTGGHAMVYEFKKVLGVDGKEYLEMHVNNAGAGINFHESRTESVSSTEEVAREEYYPVQIAVISLPLETKELPEYLKSLIIARKPVLRRELYPKDKQKVNATILYTEYLAGVHNLSNKVEFIKASDRATHAWTASQLSGTCTERALHQMIKAEFEMVGLKHEDYVKFIYSYSRDSIDEYMRNEMVELGEIDLVTRYIETRFDILNSLESTDTTFIADETAILDAHLSALKTRREVLVASGVKPSSVVPYQAPSNAFTIVPVRERAMSVASAPVPVAVPVEELPREASLLKGGADLIRSIQDILRECDELNRSHHHTTAMERLEQLFSSFPLPHDESGMENQNPFYEALNPKTDPHAMGLFINTMNRAHILYHAIYEDNVGDVALARKFSVNLSLISTLDHVASQYPSAPGNQYHQIATTMAANLLRQNQHTPYFATNNPVLDQRICQVRSLYQDTPIGDENLLGYYLKIVESMPDLISPLVALYLRSSPEDDNLLSLLKTPSLQALYYISCHHDTLKADPQFAPLIEKIQNELEMERMTGFALGEFVGKNKNLPRMIRFSETGGDRPVLKFETNASFFGWGLGDGLSKSKYSCASGAPDEALKRDYCVNQGHNASKRTENHTQMYPSEAASLITNTASNPDARKKCAEYTARTATEQVRNERDLYTLRISPTNQILDTLEYFNRKDNRSKLTDPAIQAYVEANLFEPGLLLKEVATNPTFFTDVFDVFIKQGENQSIVPATKLMIQRGLFYVRMASLVNNYLAESHPERLQQFQHHLTNLLTVNEDNDPIIKQALHQFRLTTAISRLKTSLKSKSDDLPEVAEKKQKERGELIHLIMPSYLYMKAFADRSGLSDRSEQVDLLFLEQDIKNNVLAIERSAPEEVCNAVRLAVETVGLGRCKSTPVKNGSLYTLEIDREPPDTYHVDVFLGLVYNKDNLAATPVPPKLINHPVCKYLGDVPFKPCFVKTSPGTDRPIYYALGAPETLRFYVDGETYRIQQKWLIDGQAKWFELRSHCVEQQKAFGIRTSSIDDKDLPEILKQRDNQIWIGVAEEEGSVLLTGAHQPLYYSPTGASTSARIYQKLDKQGNKNGFELCTTVENSIHKPFSRFEDPRFIIVNKKDTFFQIQFPRYHLTLTATLEGGVLVYKKEDEPDWILSPNISMDDVVHHAAGLVFENAITEQKMCISPVQEWVLAGVKRTDSQYHALDQDTRLAIPDDVVEAAKKDRDDLELLAWQYTNCSAGTKRFPIKTSGEPPNLRHEPYAESVSDALYLCYLYLGSHNIPKAWAVLEDCALRLGRFKGTPEEIAMLNLILKKLPRPLEGDKDDIGLETDEYVACQIKALSLFIKSSSPDNVVELPEDSFDSNTPDGLYCQAQLQSLKDFHSNLNNELYRLYGRYQNLYRTLKADYRLTNSERSNLLNYYLENLPEPQATGALGRDIVRLKMIMLNKEFGILEKLSHKTPAEIERHAELRAYITGEDAVSSVESHLEMVRANARIPEKYQLHCDISLLCPLADKYKKEEGPRDLVDNLTAGTRDEILFQNFGYLLKLLTRGPSPDRDKLGDFCLRRLRALHSVSMDKQSNDVAFLCNILYRIYVQEKTRPGSFTVNGSSIKTKFEQPIPAREGDRERRFRLLDIEGNFSLENVFRAARALPDPVIDIPEMKDTTKKLTTTMALGRDMADILRPKRDIIAERYAALNDFTPDHLLHEPELLSFVTLLQDCAQYRENAALFGEPPKTTEQEKDSLRTLTKSELAAGEQQLEALQEMKRLAKRMFSGTTSALSKFEEITGRYKQSIQTLLEAELQAALNLANKLPSDAPTRQRKELAIKGRARKVLDIKRLIAIYVKGDFEAYRQATDLSDEDVQQLHNKISAYMALSVRMQSLTRFEDKAKEFHKSRDPALLEDITHELLTDDLVDYTKEPQMAMIQYTDNMILRKQQIDAIQRMIQPSDPSDPNALPFSQLLVQIIMGGGKSKVILPMLAYLKAKGTNLVVIEVPRALLDTNYNDLSPESLNLFGQEAEVFEFDRSHDCSSTALKSLYKRLDDVIPLQKYIITTGDSIQSLNLKWMELLLDKPEDEKDKAEWREQVKGIEDIFLLFRNKGDMVMDEVHLSLMFKKKLNYTRGEKQPLPKDVIDHCVKLYQFFDEVKLPLGLTLADVMKNNELYTTDVQWKEALLALTRALVLSDRSPLKPILDQIKPKVTDAAGNDSQPKLTPVEIAELMKYLLNDATATIPDFILNASREARNIVALYKGQVSQLLPGTLRRKCNENYGLSHKPHQSGMAIPYSGNNSPNERSRFGNPLEAVNYTIQMILIQGFNESLLKDCLLGLKRWANQEVLDCREFMDLSINQTGGARWFNGCSNVTQETSYQFIRLELDPTSRPYKDLDPALASKSGLILYQNRFYHADHLKQKVVLIEEPEHKKALFKAFRLRFTEAHTNRAATGEELGLLSQLDEFKLTMKDLDLEDPVQFERLFQNLKMNKHLLSMMLQQNILPNILTNSQVLHANSFNKVDCLRTVQGVTGTPANRCTYDQRLKFYKHLAAATDGFLAALLRGKSPGCCFITCEKSPMDRLAEIIPELKGKNGIIKAEGQLFYVDITSGKIEKIEKKSADDAVYKNLLENFPDTYTLADVEEVTSIINPLTDRRQSIAIRAVPSGKVDDLIAGLFAGKDPSESVRAIIDICASFKGISERAVALALAKYINAHPVQFSIPEPIRYVLFFENDALSALNCRDLSVKRLASSNLNEINKTLGCGPEARFSYYDQRHITGTDLKQAKKAKALALIDHETVLENFFQGVSRMRGLKDEQSIEIIVKPHMKGKTYDELLQMMDTNSEHQLQQSHFMAVLAQLKSIIRSDFTSRLALEKDIDKKSTLASAIQDTYIDIPEQEMFALYGAITKECPIGEYLSNFSSKLIRDWQEHLKTMGLTPDNLGKIRSDMNEVIKTAEPPMCPEMVSSSMGVQDEESEQEDEVEAETTAELMAETELESELEQERQDQMDEGRNYPAHFKPWRYTGREIFPGESDGCRFSSLTELCSKCQQYKPPRPRMKTPTFGNLYASENFYNTSYSPRPFFPDQYLKSVHSLLFRRRDDGELECVMLNQEEAERMRNSAMPLNSWITDTAHFVRAGVAPEGIQATPAYKSLIEQVRYFNGELREIIDSKEPRIWLKTDPLEKMEFYERRLKKFRNARPEDIALLKKSGPLWLLGFRYIEAHPNVDYSTFDWKAKINKEFSDDDIDACKAFAAGITRANTVLVEQVSEALGRAKTLSGMMMVKRGELTPELRDPWRLFHLEVPSESIGIPNGSIAEQFLQKYLRDKLQPLTKLFIPFMQGSNREYDQGCPIKNFDSILI